MISKAQHCVGKDLLGFLFDLCSSSGGLRVVQPMDSQVEIALQKAHGAGQSAKHSSERLPRFLVSVSSSSLF